MRKIENLNWREFVLNKLFEINSTKSSIDRNKLTGKFGDYPYVTRTDCDNGIDSFIAMQPNYKKDEGNVITIGLDTQTVFYQPAEFYTGQNIQILRNGHLNKYVAMFIVPLIKKQMKKFNWGGNGATLGRLKKLTLLLPSNELNEPDYEYMGEYMKQVEIKLLKRYKKYLSLKDITSPRISECILMKEMRLDTLFNILPGVRLVKQDQIDGETPFIGSTDSNNGITAFCGNKNLSEDKNLLGVNYNGSVVENFYHPYKALFSDDVKRFHLKDRIGNKYIYLYLKNCILKQQQKYQYGYKFNGQRMKEQKIMIPVTKSLRPDYEYMENYMRIVEYRLLKRYINKRLKQLDKA